MSEWRRLYLRLKDLIHPPSYPEYKEYRRDDQEPASQGAGSDGEEASKFRRVKLVGAFAVLVSVGGTAWMYFAESTRLPSAEDPRVRGALASQVLASAGVDGAQQAPRDNLEEIKRWAVDLERRAERNLDSVPVLVSGHSRPLASYYGQGFDASLPLALPPPTLPYDSFPETPAYGDFVAPFPGGVSAVSVRTAREPDSAYFTSNHPIEPVIQPTAPPAFSPTAPPTDHASPSDSPATRYTPSAYEPIDYRPRTLERY